MSENDWFFEIFSGNAEQYGPSKAWYVVTAIVVVLLFMGFLIGVAA